MSLLRWTLHSKMSSASGQAIELALLGGQQWQYAEKKATVALKATCSSHCHAVCNELHSCEDSPDKEVLLKLLKVPKKPK